MASDLRMTKGCFPMVIARERRSVTKAITLLMLTANFTLTGFVPFVPLYMRPWSLLLFVVAGVVGARRVLADRRLVQRVVDENDVLCPRCGYSLAGLPDSHTCPECGLEYDIDVVRSIWDAWCRKDIFLWGLRNRSGK